MTRLLELVLVLSGVAFLLVNLALFLWLDWRPGTRFTRKTSEAPANETATARVGEATVTQEVQEEEGEGEEDEGGEEVGGADLDEGEDDTQQSYSTGSPGAGRGEHQPPLVSSAGESYQPIPAALAIGPRYEHDASMLSLPRSIKLPSFLNCSASLRARATFWVVTFYSKAYEGKAARLRASCDKFSVCCVGALVPADAFESHHVS